MASPWDATFDRVRVVYTPGRVYDRSLREIPALLDEAERELGTRFPESYRAFMLRFGPGELENRFNMLQPVQNSYGGGFLDWTRHCRGFFEVEADSFHNAAWLAQLVYFGSDGLGDHYAWHPRELTSSQPHDCRFYHLQRGQEETPEVAGENFADFLHWAEAEARERAEETTEPPTGFLFHPKELRRREKPKHSDVHRWLFFNNRTARLIAKSIRDENRADAFPILADALQDAGCAHADLLDACRAGDPDVDGRWVLQVLFGEP